MGTLWKAKKYILIFLCLVGVLFIYRKELKLLFVSDPIKDFIYEYSFHESLIEYAQHIEKIEGFKTDNRGLELLPGTSGAITFSFDKKLDQGCLLSVWLYGDGGKERPNAIKISTDAGKTFAELGKNGNYIGTVFELSSYVKGTKHFLLLIEAENHASYIPVVLDKIEITVTQGSQAKPLLPTLPAIIVLVCLVFLVPFVLFRHDNTGSEIASAVLFLLILALAASLRWIELGRVAGTALGGDAKGYFTFAQNMDLFSENGFFSAQFDQREPLFICVIRIFLLFFGISETHLRFVSFVFSLVMIYLTYRIGREWFNNVTGLVAAFILAVHPYLIELSARGLRAEWFTTLILLFVYYGYVKEPMGARWRVLVTGLLIGALLLTRTETLLMILIVMAIYPLVAQSRWNYKRALFALFLGICLLIPHLYSIYQKHGDPFYTMNKYARFYANREFLDKPDFPTRKEVIEQGMYTGPTITPFDYYLKLHTPEQLIRYSVVGFIKIHLTMPLGFGLGKGNLRTVTSSLKELTNNYGKDQLMETGRLFMSIVRKDFWDYCMVCAVLVSFICGLIVMALSRCWMMFIYLLVFQIQTSFLAYLGIDARLTVHSYPLIALCCGYCIWRVSSGLQRRFVRPVVSTPALATD